MTVRSDQFMMALLKWKNLPVSSNNVRSMVIWKVSEGSNARWNPMDTEWPMPGATNYNPQGVKNYPDITTGIEAFWNTMDQEQYQASYGPIFQALEESQPPAVTCAHISASIWGSKPTSAEVQEVLTNFEYYASQPIAGSADVVEPTVDNTPGPVTPKLPMKEPKMLETSNGKYVTIIITPTGDILEVSRPVGNIGAPIQDSNDLSVIDVTSKYPEFKGATVA